MIIAGGSKSINAYEQAVLHAALNILGERERKMVSQQLKQRYFIQRLNDDRINAFHFYEPNDELRVPDEAFSDMLIKVKFRLDGRLHTAHVTFYKGNLYSVEFNKPGKIYHSKALEIIGAEIGKPSQSYTRVIDRSAHGRNEYDN